jgi:hypothetical protein
MIGVLDTPGSPWRIGSQETPRHRPGNCRHCGVDGSIERADLDGGNRRITIPEGGTFTPKQLHLEKKSAKLYWSDREGMRVMRANPDGSLVETVIQTGEGEDDRHDPSKSCVGIIVDPIRRQMYWIQKGADDSGHGRIFRVGIDMPRGQTPTSRTDVEVLCERLPEPIDLELDLEDCVLVDNQEPPLGSHLEALKSSITCETASKLWPRG